MAKPRTADLSSAPTADQIVCACKNLTYGTLSELAVSTGSFDEVMARSGAGQECTACLLDLEYYFGLQQVGTGWQDGKLAPNVNRADSPKLRHRIFALLDSLSPLSPQRLRDLGPILRCEGISQHLIIANHSLLFDEKRSTPDMSVRVDVRDQNGTLCHREESVLGIDDRMDLCISDFLPKPEAGEISIGSVVVERRA
ncbi:MAG: (2Fe-2S)-binding protein, partial [Pseudomonadota bacterium]|nr:(2Fe-2S)-binding protein [Pseudomonadota bacterium]